MEKIIEAIKDKLILGWLHGFAEISGDRTGCTIKFFAGPESDTPYDKVHVGFDDPAFGDRFVERVLDGDTGKTITIGCDGDWLVTDFYIAIGAYD